MSLQAREGAREGRHPRRLVLEVDLVLDVRVEGEDGGVVLARAPEAEAALIAGHDLPEGAVVQARARHEAGTADPMEPLVAHHGRDAAAPAERAGDIVQAQLVAGGHGLTLRVSRGGLSNRD